MKIGRSETTIPCSATADLTLDATETPKKRNSVKQSCSQKKVKLVSIILASVLTAQNTWPQSMHCGASDKVCGAWAHKAEARGEVPNNIGRSET